MADVSQVAVVPVSDPAHPSHSHWLEILLTALRAAVAIGPAVIAVTRPGDAQLAANLGQIAQAGLSTLPSGL